MSAVYTFPVPAVSTAFPANVGQTPEATRRGRYPRESIPHDRAYKLWRPSDYNLKHHT